MPMIPLQPDDGSLDPLPATATVDGGRPDEAWLGVAWADIHQHGSWAAIPKGLKRDKVIEQRNRAAWLAYGIEPFSVALPKADPLSIRLRLGRFANTAADRRAQIRLLARDVAAADPRRTGLRASRSRERLTWHVRTRPNEVEAAHKLVAHFDSISRGLGRRIARGALESNSWAILAIGYMVALLAMALAPEGPHFRVWQGALAASVALFCAYRLGMTKGRWHGYNQATWHCAEVAVDHSTEAAQLSEEAARRAEELARRAEEDARVIAGRRMAFKLPRQPHGEGYLYVVEFGTGTVKVGQTEDPQKRLATHRGEAQAFGVHIVNYWISPSHLNFRANETRLINRCVEVSHRSRKEYFHAVAYDRAVEFAGALTYHSKDTSQTSVEGVWA